MCACKRNVQREKGVGWVVEVFDLVGHPKASIADAWNYAGGHRVAVLHLGSIKSAADAVRAAIVQELRSLERPEEA